MSASTAAWMAFAWFGLGGLWMWWVASVVFRPRWEEHAAVKALCDHEARRRKMLADAAARVSREPNATIPAVLHGGPFDGLPTEFAADREWAVWQDPSSGQRAVYRFTPRSVRGRWVLEHVKAREVVP